MTPQIPLDKLLVILGSLGGLVYVFYKGWRHGKDSERLKQLDAEEKLEAEVRQAEAANLKEDESRDKAINEINAADTITALISVFDKLFNKKDPR